MADREQNPIDALLQELISSRRSATSLFEDLDSSSFVEGFLKVSSSKLNESIRELVEFLGGTLSDENLRDLSRRIERARIPTQDKRALGEGIQIAKDISDILTDLATNLEELGGQSESLRKELDFLINSFGELKTYAGKNLREFIQEYQELLDSQRESLENFLDEMGGARQFGRYFYLSKLDENKYREESYLISQPGFFRSFEDYAKLVGPGALFKSTESLIKSAVEDIRLSSSIFSFLSGLPARERIFNPDITTITDFQKNIFKRIPQEFAQAKQITNISLLELSERINTLLKAPESERDYITLSKLVTQREELQKRLLALLREEIEYRQEFNRRTYGMFLEASKDFGLRAIDKIFSTTRNPFVDIFTESFRFAFSIGSQVYSGTRNLLNLIPTGIPRGGASRPPNRPSSPSTRPSSPSSGPTTSPKTTIPPIWRGAGRLVGGALGGYGIGVIQDVLFEKKDIKEALTSPSNIGAGIGAALGGTLLAPFGLAPLGMIGGGIFGSYIGGLFERNKKETDIKEISLRELAERTSKQSTINNFYLNPTNTPRTGNEFLTNLEISKKESGDKELLFFSTQTSLQNLGLAALTASGSLNNLGLSAGRLSINFGELAKTSASFATGLASAGIAFVSDFYLQSMNRAYDIYYQQFTQQNLMPQMIRRQLGATTAEISRNLVTPGTGLLFQGPLSVAGLGFERTELLAGASRVANQMLIRSAEDLAERLKEAANVARIFGTNLEQGVGAIALLRRSTLEYSDLFRTSYVLTRTEPTAFTKAMAEAVIQASLSLSIQQGISPRRYLESFERVQTLLITSSNRTLAELARNNIEITRNIVNSFNEFIRSGLNNPIVGGIGIRAGLTPRGMLLGATPENMTRVIRQLSLELGLPGSLVGGRFSGQAREYLLPLIQNLLGLTNISPDAFNEIVLSVITGRDAQAQRLIREAQRAPLPRAVPSDRDFAKNIDQLNISYQNLTNVISRNIESITKLNEAINNLTVSILNLGDQIIPNILEIIANLAREAGFSISEFLGPKNAQSYIQEERKSSSLDKQQISELLPETIRPMSSIQQIPKFLSRTREPSVQQESKPLKGIRPTRTQQIPTSPFEAERMGSSYTKQTPTKTETLTFLEGKTTTLLVSERINNALQSSLASSNINKESRRPIPTSKDIVDSVVASLLSPRSLTFSKEIIQSKKEPSLEAQSMSKEISGQILQLPPSYSGYALVKIEKIPEPLTSEFLENLIRSYNKRGRK